MILSTKVLIDLNVVVSGTLCEAETNSALEKYRNTAVALMKDETVRAVCRLLIDITSGPCPESGFSDLPFVFLEGSSGTGKSQMAFNIAASMCDTAQDSSFQRKVYYFLFSRPGSGSQQIYLNFKNISNLFEQCCRKDESHYDGEASSPNCESIFKAELFVYGFIYVLLSNEIPTSAVTVCSKTGKEVRDLMITKQIDNCRPVFIVDECIALSGTSSKKVRFVRNCFRSLGLGTVLLGTDSRAAKLTSYIGKSSRGEPMTWCHVISKYPAVNLSLLDLPIDAPDWLKSILQISRPLFAQLVATQYSNDPRASFDKLMNHRF